MLFQSSLQSCFCFYHVYWAQVLVYLKFCPSRQRLKFYCGSRTLSLKTKTRVSKTGCPTPTSTPAAGPALPATHEFTHLSPLTSPKLESTTSSPSVFVAFTPSKAFSWLPISSPTQSPSTLCFSVPTSVSWTSPTIISSESCRNSRRSSPNWES